METHEELLIVNSQVYQRKRRQSFNPRQASWFQTHRDEGAQDYSLKYGRRDEGTQVADVQLSQQRVQLWLISAQHPEERSDQNSIQGKWNNPGAFSAGEEKPDREKNLLSTGSVSGSAWAIA